MREKEAIYLFESARKHKYTDRGIRKMLARYAKTAGITRSVSPHKWRHFLFTWLKKQGIDDALIQPYSGHVSRQSLEIYSKLSLADAQQEYNQAVIGITVQFVIGIIGTLVLLFLSIRFIRRLQDRPNRFFLSLLSILVCICAIVIFWGTIFAVNRGGEGSSQFTLDRFRPTHRIHLTVSS